MVGKCIWPKKKLSQMHIFVLRTSPECSEDWNSLTSKDDTLKVKYSDEEAV